MHFHMHPSTQHHFHQFHNATSGKEDSDHDVGYCSDIDVISEVPFSDLITKALSPPELLVDAFGNHKSIQYFSAQLTGRGSGAAEIVSRSQFVVCSLAHQLTSSEVSGQLLLSEFSFNISHNMRCMFADVLAYVVQSTKDDFLSDQSDYHSKLTCKVPQTYAQIRSFYTDGADAIMLNLPHPHVKTITSHSYMSLYHIVADHLAFFFRDELVLEQSGERAAGWSLHHS